MISEITPDINSLNIGDEVTISGSLLDIVSKVEFGTIDAGIFTYDNGTITCTVLV